MPRRWLTTDAARTVREIVANDGTIADVCRELGVSRSAVQRALRRWGVRLARGQRRDVDLRVRVIDAVRRGNATCRDVARAMGFTRNRASELVRELVADGILETTGRSNAYRVRVIKGWDRADRET